MKVRYPAKVKRHDKWRRYCKFRCWYCESGAHKNSRSGEKAADEAIKEAISCQSRS